LASAAASCYPPRFHPQGQGCIEYGFHNPAKGGAIEDKVTYVLRVSGDLWVASGTYVVHK
jgi:hypothetical protein